MKNKKRFLKAITLSLALAGIFCTSGFLLNNNPQMASADFSVIENLEKDTPEYLQISTQGSNVSFANDNLFLFQAEEFFNVQIANNESHIITEEIEGVTKTNYAYRPSSQIGVDNPQYFYYFDFQSSLSLYYNLTEDDIKAGFTDINLITKQDISNYAKPNNNAFMPSEISFAPQKFDLQFKLDLLIDDVDCENNVVTLNKEGCYTLVIPVIEYYTNNGGASFEAREETIYYSFMAFNANSYFDPSTGKPKISTSENMHQSLLGSTSNDFSTYYYYNYAYGKNDKVNTLPEFTYNPNYYRLEVVFNDLENQKTSTFIEYQNNQIIQLDYDGNEIIENDQFIKVRKNSEDSATVTFYNLGSYDIKVTYLYTVTNQNGSTTYYLPFEKLNNNDNNTIFNAKAQRLYIYGYQAMYSDYANTNPSTNQPVSVDLKTYDFKQGTYSNSADITSLVNSKANLTNISQSTSFSELYDTATQVIEENKIAPISTNQTPIKFMTNANNTTLSKIYKDTGNHLATDENWVKQEDWEESGEFQGFNVNTAGTFLYIIQYKFDSYMSSSGILQSAYYHYQIFYFKVTNTAPTVDVVEMDENYGEVYTNGYTNKSVYILNNAENSNYDAEVYITLSAKNYKTGTYYFEDADIKNLSSYGIYYTQFAEDTSEDANEKYNKKIANKYGVLIENTNKFANAEFTIKIIPLISKDNANNKPSTRKFTIDTSPIQNITARNVSVQTSTSYKLLNQSFDGYATNTPFVLSWDEKESEAKTYGFVKYIPTSSINYYSSLYDDDLAELLSRLMSHDTLPVSYKIDLSATASATWTEYYNTYEYTKNVPSNHVKSSDGFYILEVYDEAGNVNFEIYLLDSSSPIFIEEIAGADITIQKILSNGESLTIPESNVDITIKWTSNKAIYLENMADLSTSEIKAYQYGIDTEHADQVLKEKISTFFNTSNENITTFNNISAKPTLPTDEEKLNDGLIPTGIKNYNSNYLVIPINDIVYIKEGDSNTYKPFTQSSYQITFFDEQTGEAIADGKTFKILLRDEANTIDTNNIDENYKNYPSGYTSFNVTSDASKLSVSTYQKDNKGDWNWNNLEFSTYSMNGLLYSYTDVNGQLAYTHQGDEEKIENGEQNATNLGYKFSYYTPINNRYEVQISYIPVAKNGSKLKSVNLTYYPFELKSTTIEGNSNLYYYYDITEDVNKIKTVNIFTASQKTYDQDQVETFNVSLGSESTPLAGRYVIERTYMQDNEVDKYDYFRRTLTFIVDDFNLISPLENVTNGADKASLESVVGGDIVLSMYSGENNSSIEVSFPSYNENGLNTGSFYTKESFNSIDENPSFSVEGNKLPMTLYIPEYKYTISNQRDTTTNKYSVTKNNNLSYYGNACVEHNAVSGYWDVYVEGVVVDSFPREQDAIEYVNKYISITEYQIYAKIEVTGTKDNTPLYYYSTSESPTSNGYLNFYLGDEYGNIIDTTPVEYFFKQGNYVVTLFQANNAGSSSSFYAFYKFGFTIKSQAPDFDIIGTDGYQLTEDEVSPNVYYTNSSMLKVEWQIPSSEFEARINEGEYDEYGTPVKGITIRSSIWNAFIYSGEIVDNKTSRYFTIDTTDLLKLNNGFIEITMEYYGHNQEYYDTVKKIIYFDKSAPTQNLQTLMGLTENATNRAFPTNYQLMYMRSYQDYDGNEMAIKSVDDISKASYSYSLNSGYFKYYSYNVTKEFFTKTLLETVLNANANPYETQTIYYKYIDNIDIYTQVDKASFNRDYRFIDPDENPRIICGYYEIVEMDYAGNMTVYVVFVVDSVDSDDSNVRTDAITYSNNRLTEVIEDEQIVNGFNIYSTSGFNIDDLNYKSDPWAFITIEKSGQGSLQYLKSPWLNDSQIYSVEFAPSGVVFKQVSLSSLFDNVTSSPNKHKLTLTNRIDGTNSIVYLSVMDASLSTQKVVDPNKTSAKLNISVPTPAQVQSTTTAYIYPVNIKIQQFDTNDAGWIEIMDADQITYGSWTPTKDYLDRSYIAFNTLADGKTLQIIINLGANATQKVKYLITDNFGKTTTIIQLANEVEYREISGPSIIYSEYESDGSVTHISSNEIRYSYNVLLYEVKIFDKEGDDITESFKPNINVATNIAVITFAPSTQYYYDDYYKIQVWDSEDDGVEPLKTIHIRLYNKLPFLSTRAEDVVNGAIIFNDKNQQPISQANIGTIPNKTISFNGKNYTTSAEYITTYSQNVTIRFKNGQDLAFEGGYTYLNGYPYSVYLSRDDGLTWENINNSNSDTSGYTVSGFGDYLVFIKYDSEEFFTNMCKIYSLSILDASTSYYFITVDGIAVEKSGIKYTSLDNREYDVNYIVSVDFADKENRLKITPNEELDVTLSEPTIDNTGTLVYVEIYHYECGESVGDFTIIYIAETNNIVNSLTYETTTGTTSIKDIAKSTIVENDPNFNQLKINFTSFYGISSNKINVEVLKLFNGIYTILDTPIYTDGNISYFYLDIAGSYRLKFYDSCTPMNVQLFKNSQYFDLIFLNYVPFTVSYTDSNGQKVVSEGMQKAVYNSTVNITPTNLSTYYQATGYPKISVKLNGHEYTKYTENNRVYTFSTPGYYTIKFSATSTEGPVREEEFNFTIINPNESRDAFEFTRYKQYYVEQVIKNGIDITEDLIKMANFEIVTINNKQYLSTLSLSYLDNKTGEGKYKIVINHNRQDLANIIGQNFTFELFINHVTTLPINVYTSKGVLKEGASATEAINVTFNVGNLYQTAGDCYIKIGDFIRYYNSNNISSYDKTETITISNTGTHYIQVYTTGGKLLYSYKVVKTEPLNAFAIIAIILGVITVITIVAITIKLRKRQKVK